MKSRQKGFTLIELLVVIAIIALLIAILMPALGKAREQSKRATCASNFKQIFTSMYTYSSDSQGAFPQLPVTTDAAGVITGTVTTENAAGYTCNVEPQKAENPFGLVAGTTPNKGIADRPAKTVSSNLWLLVRGDFTQADIFICPSSDKAGNKPNLRDTSGTGTPAAGAGVGAEYFVDFPYGTAQPVISPDKSIAYSFIQPWTQFSGSKGSWDMWGADGDPRAVIGGDENNNVGPAFGNAATAQPSSSEQKANINSLNHTGDGQNLMYGDGHAAWSATCYAGISNDNVYASRYNGTGNFAAVKDVRPAYDTANPTNLDTVLVPMDNAKLAAVSWLTACKY